MKKALLLCALLATACQNRPEGQDAAFPNSEASSRSESSKERPGTNDLPVIDTLLGFRGRPDLEDSLGQSYLDFGSAALILQGNFPQEKKGDTLVLRELPMRFFYQKRLNSEILDSGITLKAYLSISEQVQQIYPYSNDDPNREDFEIWKVNRQQWQAWQDFQYLPLEDGDYRIPLLNALNNSDPSEELFQALALKDTLIEYPGEMGGNKAEFLFLGEPAAYTIPEALIKVELYRGEALIDEHYISLIFSYGC